jgi:hypothetical protein
LCADTLTEKSPSETGFLNHHDPALMLFAANGGTVAPRRNPKSSSPARACGSRPMTSRPMSQLKRESFDVEKPATLPNC